MILLEIDGWQVFIQFMSFIVPAAIVFGICYYFISKFVDEQHTLRLLELKKEQMKELTPLKLQAYERLTLFLDRVSPDNLVVRLSKRGQSAAQLRAELVGTISGEYNHNISQQIYVSDDAWKMIQAVKEQIIGLVEQCYSECAEGESGPQLGKRILTRLMEQNAAPTQNAIHLLKKEIEIAL